MSDAPAIPRKKPPAPSVKPKRTSRGSGTFPRWFIIESHEPCLIEGDVWRWDPRTCYLVWKDRSTWTGVGWDGQRQAPGPDADRFNFRINCLMEEKGVLRSASREEAEAHRLAGHAARQKGRD